MSHPILVAHLDLQLPLLPQQLLDMAEHRVLEVLQHVVTLLLLVLIVFLKTAGVMDVITMMHVLLLVVLVVAVLESKRLVVGCS